MSCWCWCWFSLYWGIIAGLVTSLVDRLMGSEMVDAHTYTVRCVLLTYNAQCNVGLPVIVAITLYYIVTASLNDVSPLRVQ